MKVIIDMQNMRFVAKHESAPALMHYADIELPHLPIKVEFCDDHEFLKNLTDLEVFMLYKNTVGTVPTVMGQRLRTVLIEAVSRMPTLDADVAELAAQAKFIDRQDKRQYKYIKGSNIPWLVDDLFEIPPLVVVKSTDEARIAQMTPRNLCHELFPGVDYEEEYARHIVSRDHRTMEPAPVPTQELRDIMDAMMEEAGTPTDPNALEKLMREIISKITEDFRLTPKRATTEFVAWVQARAQVA